MKPIDLRSDTVTRPTPGMRKAMAEAEVGDDVFGEDPTVRRLEARVAELLGFEAALFVPSGTMGNAIAIRILTRRGDEVLVERRSHVVRYELSAMSVLSGVMPRTVEAPDGHVTPQQVQEAVAPPAYYKSDVSLVVLENTHNLAGGTIQGIEATRAVIQASREAGFRIHVDGARIWNAAVALGVAPSALVAGADTVMTCLSKGLGCPVGSLVAASRELVEEGRRARKLLGGGLRQAGHLAAAGLWALDEGIGRLEEDHARARRLGEALGQAPGVSVSPPRTNIVVATFEDRTAPAVVSALAERGVLAIAMDGRTLRLVTHRDVTESDCTRAVEAIGTALG
jgi:threonine aldolase